jgi:hypothetical protein
MFSFEQLAAQPQGETGRAPYDRWLTLDGSEVALFYRTPDSFYVRFQGKADFALSIETGSVTCTPAPHVADQIIVDLFHNQVVPLLLNHQGELVLHASAVSSPSGALGFIGHSGSGKSTLAAYFAQSGHPFLTDDGLLLQPTDPDYTVNPYRPYLRLWPDSDNALFQRGYATESYGQDGKSLIDAGPLLPFQHRPVAIAALFLLGPGKSDAVAISRLKPAVALMELIKHSFILDVEDQPRLKGHFERLVRLSEAVDCFVLDYPREYEALPKVVTAVLRSVEKAKVHVANG